MSAETFPSSASGGINLLDLHIDLDGQVGLTDSLLSTAIAVVNKTMLAYRPLSSQFWSLDFFFSQ
jgi:hypothetical protein